MFAFLRTNNIVVHVTAKTSLLHTCLPAPLSRLEAIPCRATERGVSSRQHALYATRQTIVETKQPTFATTARRGRNDSLVGGAMCRCSGTVGVCHTLRRPRLLQALQLQCAKYTVAACMTERADFAAAVLVEMHGKWWEPPTKSKLQLCPTLSTFQLRLGVFVPRLELCYKYHRITIKVTA